MYVLLLWKWSRYRQRKITINFFIYYAAHFIANYISCGSKMFAHAWDKILPLVLLLIELQTQQSSTAASGVLYLSCQRPSTTVSILSTLFTDTFYIYFIHFLCQTIAVFFLFSFLFLFVNNSIISRVYNISNDDACYFFVI